MFAFGKTQALASVSGPIEVRLAAELPSRAALEVIVRPLAGVPGTAEKTLGRRVREVLEQVLLLNHHPRTLVQLVLQSLSSSSHPSKSASHSIHPSQAAALINAASLALLHASSVPMRGVICAIAVGKLRGTGTIQLDPEPETSDCERIGCFAFLFTEGLPGQVVWADWHGAFNEDEYVKVVDLARVGSQFVLDTIRKELEGEPEVNSRMDMS